MNKYHRNACWLAFAIVAVTTTACIMAGSRDFGTLARNSLLLASVANDVDWDPAHVPPEFIEETQPPPAYARTAAGKATAGAGHDDLSRALAIARHIGDNPRRGGPIRRNTPDTWSRVRQQGRGYCADYSQIFLAFSLAAGIPVREWGFGEEGFGSGHAFNEIYSRQLDKWIFIDAFQAFYVTDRVSGLPLSVTEFRRRLLDTANTRTLQVVPIDAQQFRFDTVDEALDYYRQSAAFVYLFLGNNVFDYDGNALIGLVGAWSRTLEIVTAIAIGVQPRIQILPDETNGDEIATLRAWRLALIAAAVLLPLLFLCLIVEIARGRRPAERVQ